MDAFSRLNLNSLPTIAGAGLGASAALACALAPPAWLDAAMGAASVAALIPAAEPPIGLVARAVLAGGLGVGSGAVAWAALYLLFGPGGAFHRPGRSDGAPAVRRADAHPDAPPRKPFNAADFGLPIEGESRIPDRLVPADLDQPLADFDPQAVPAAPREPVRPVPPLARSEPPARASDPLAPGERIKSVELAPPFLHADEADTPSIEALLARLERGATRRVVRRAG